MTNPIRIKRRPLNSAGGPPPFMFNAELAFNESDETLYYGLGIDNNGYATSYLPISGPGSFVTRSTTQTISGSKTFTGGVSLTSPTLTGVPVAPTAAPGTSTTQIATTGFVVTEVFNLIDSAPTALNTLNELAAALGDDPNFATTVTNLIGTKLDSSAYTAADVLTKIKTVDGTGSGLDADLLDGESLVDSAATSNSVVGRDGLGDIHARLIRQTFADGESISGGLVFRINNSTDNFLRVCNNIPAIRTFLDVPSRTGGSASGTWGISITGNASTVTTNANLTGDVTSVGNATSIAPGVIVNADINASAGIVDTKLATIATSGKVSNSATTATSANTANAIVSRDVSGNFTAGTVTANLTGNASTSSAWATGRVITLTGDITGTSASWTGSGDLSFATTLANSGVTAGTVNNSTTAITPLTIDSKGRITSTGGAVVITPSWSSITSKPTTISGFGITDAASISSPAFTGVPTAPTAVGGTSTTQLATTAFVVNEIATGPTGPSISLSSPRTFALTGDVVGSVSSDLSSGMSIATAIGASVIVNADVNASAAISGTKIAPDFGSQNTTTTGSSTAARFVPTSATAPTNGLYLPDADTVGIATSTTAKFAIDSFDGNPLIETSYPEVMPSLDLYFARTKRLDPRATFSRASTATYYDANGVVQTAASDVPRFDHDPATGESLGLMMEEARTNLTLQSNNPEDGVWNKINTTATAGVAVSPTLAMDASSIIEDTSTGLHTIQQLFSTVSGTQYAIHGFFKLLGSGSPRRLQILCSSQNFPATPTAIFDLSLGTVVFATNGTAKILPLANGWFHCKLITIAANLSGLNPYSFRLEDGSSSNYTGDGTSGIYFWGAQLEAGSLPTSYIPTTSSTATRAADVCTLANNNIYNTDNFTIINQPYGIAAGGSTLSLYPSEDPIKRVTIYSRDLTQPTINAVAGKTDEFWRWRILGASFALPSFTTDGQVTVDWGDGTVETLTTGVHTFSNGAGYHDIGFRLDSGTYFRPYIDDNASYDTLVVGVGPAPASMKLSALRAFHGCTNLKSFDATVDATGGTDFQSAWQNCSSLTNFPVLNVSSGTNFFQAWYQCSSLTSFPANFFDVTGTLVSTAFTNAFFGCALTAASIENILISLVTNGQSNITLGLDGGTNAGAATWTANAITAYDTLISRGWTITRNA